MDGTSRRAGGSPAGGGGRSGRRRRAPRPLLTGFLVLLFLLFGSPFLLSPIFLRMALKSPTADRLEVLGPGELDLLPPEATSYLDAQTEAFVALGFEPVVSLGLPTSLPGGVLALRVHSHRDRRVLASAAWVLPAPDSDVVEVVELGTELVDGTEIATTNDDAGAPLVERAARIVTKFPGETDVTRLVELHRASLAVHAPKVERRSIAPAAVVDEVRASLDRDATAYLASGWFFLDPEERVLRPTWWGAAWLGWRDLWPFGAVRQRRFERASSERRARVEAALAAGAVSGAPADAARPAAAP